MALRRKVLSKELEVDESAHEQSSQRRKPDIGQFRLQITGRPRHHLKHSTPPRRPAWSSRRDTRSFACRSTTRWSASIAYSNCRRRKSAALMPLVHNSNAVRLTVRHIENPVGIDEHAVRAREPTL